MFLEMGLIRSNISIGSDINGIYSVDISQTVPIHVTDPYSVPEFVLDREHAAG